MLLAFAVSGCERLSDEEQDSICRRVLPAVVDVSGGVTLSRSMQNGPQQIVLIYTLGQDPTFYHLLCEFAGGGLSLNKRDLVGVRVNGHTLSQAAVFYLRRGWLLTPDAISAAPPANRGAPPLSLPPTVAYMLQQALSALPRIGIYALIASAYSLLYGLTGRINLAFGAFSALGGMCAVLAIRLVDALDLPLLTPTLAAGAMIAGCSAALCGNAVARLVIAPMARRRGQHILVASAGLMLVIEEFLRLTQGANALWLAPIFTNPLLVATTTGFEVTVTPMALAVSIIGVLAALFLLILVRYSDFGRNWRAVSDDPLAGELFGVDHRGLLIETFGLATAVAGFAGFLVALHYGGIGFTGGTMLGLTALVAAIVGGIGSLPGALMGGVLIGLIEAVWSAFMPIVYKDGVVFLFLAVLLALRPAGLFGGRQPGPMRV